jgi:orotate phosphoribosyltransferase
VPLPPDDPWAAYARTVVRIARPGEPALVVQGAPGDARGGWPWTSGEPVHVLTAWDPGTERLGERENRARQADLEEDIARLGPTGSWPAVGLDPVSGQREEGLAVRGLSEDVVRRVGARYDQDAIFSWTPAAWAIVACAGERRVELGWTTGEGTVPAATPRSDATGERTGRMGGVTLAARVFAASHLTGSFVLRSGRKADHYFDKYRFESDPALLADIVAALVPLVPPTVEGLAGLELGGVPLATMLSSVTGLPAYFVRKEPKKYGTEKVCEGGDVEGRRLLIIEDVVTTGGQMVLSAQDLRAEGAIVEHAVCVIDREGGGADVVGAEGIELRALFTMGDLERLRT